MTTTTVQRHLSDEQIARYRRDGYLAVPRVIDAERVQALRRVTDAFVERSRSLSRSDAVYDLDSRHTAAAPIVRRIKNPADHDPLYAWVALESPILDIVAELLGPSIRFHHSKLNLKGGHVGAPVEVHQDAAFYPHSNDDVLAVALLLDDAKTADNGAMSVLPGSHRGPIYTHYDAQGRFVGGMRAEDIARLDRSGAMLLTPAGSIHIHHYRLVHWSATNTSPADRRLLINAYSAADAIPLAADPTGSPRYGRLVRGTYPSVARRTAGDMPMPPDFSGGYTSIYELQQSDAVNP